MLLEQKSGIWPKSLVYWLQQFQQQKGNVFQEVGKWKVYCITERKGNFDKWMAITQEMKVDLIWWLNHNSEGDRKILRKGTGRSVYRCVKLRLG